MNNDVSEETLRKLLEKFGTGVSNLELKDFVFICTMDKNTFADYWHLVSCISKVEVYHLSRKIFEKKKLYTSFQSFLRDLQIFSVVGETIERVCSVIQRTEE